MIVLPGARAVIKPLGDTLATVVCDELHCTWLCKLDGAFVLNWNVDPTNAESCDGLIDSVPRFDPPDDVPPPSPAIVGTVPWPHAEIASVASTNGNTMCIRILNFRTDSMPRRRRSPSPGDSPAAIHKETTMYDASASVTNDFAAWSTHADGQSFAAVRLVTAHD